MRIEVRSPYDRSLLDTLEATAEDGVERALATAHALFRDRGGWLPASARIDILRNAARRMAAQAESLAVAAAGEGGKPLADSRVEVARAIDGVTNCCELLRSEAG